MTKTLIIAALASLIAAPTLAGGISAAEWFALQAEADGNRTFRAAPARTPTVIISTHGARTSTPQTAAMEDR